MVRVAKLAAAS